MKEITLQFVLQADKVSLTFMNEVAKALVKEGVLKREDEIQTGGSSSTRTPSR